MSKTKLWFLFPNLVYTQYVSINGIIIPWVALVPNLAVVLDSSYYLLPHIFFISKCCYSVFHIYHRAFLLSPVYTTPSSHRDLCTHLLLVSFLLTLALLQITVHTAAKGILLKQKSDSPILTHFPSLAPLSLRTGACTIARNLHTVLLIEVFWHPTEKGVSHSPVTCSSLIGLYLYLEYLSLLQCMLYIYLFISLTFIHPPLECKLHEVEGLVYFIQG